MKLGFLTAAFSRLDARAGGELGCVGRLRDARDRLLAGGRRRATALRGHHAHRRRLVRPRRGARAPRRARARDLRARLLPEQPPSRRGPPRRGQRASAQGRRRRTALGVGVVGTFAGNDQTKSPPDNLRALRDVCLPLAAPAEERGVKIAIENCPMIFSYDEWPGGTNFARSPALWDEMFEAIPSASFGLNLDPRTSSGR
jgi:sugar phosphate isomerase/epimerase